jgi:hypothetical protein
MRGNAWWTGSTVIAVSLWMLSAHVLAQNAAEPNQQPVAPGQDTAADAPANSPDQIKRAQIELKRLDCLKGRVDGKLGEQTRQAVKKFWENAKEPVVEVRITDELIADLAEHGDNYCRPARPFFGFGRGGVMPMLAPGMRPIPLPAGTPPPPAPAQNQ